MQKKDFPGLYLQSPKLNQLNILREVAADAHITQAELATRCSLSVAMVNNYMKELCRIGLMEYHRRTIKSVTYHLTSEGTKELESLQGEMVCELLEMYVLSKKKILDRIMSHAPGGIRRVILFGPSHMAQLAFHALETASVKVLGVCDDDLNLIGSDFCGQEVMSFSQARFLSPDAVIVAQEPHTEEVRQSLESLGNRGVKIIYLDGKSFPAGKSHQDIATPATPSDKIPDKKAALPLFRTGSPQSSF
jgi:predicted transcriptional regulator